MKKETPETALKARAKKLLAAFRIWTFPILQGMGAHPGIADRLGIWEKGKCPYCGGQIAQALALEFKRPAGTISPKTGKPMQAGILSAEQKEFGSQWTRSGGLYVPIWKEEDLIEALKLPVKRLF